ncbi:hypothetical protein COCMIDRAFT_85881 [Bipolaris oryzae ATCC 44560]|uniref:MYND-type domain-containing protein n=1 Tax=Bipolaris oryzae ATCC 44560 TaxID=930090 RepID=W6ZYY0_COCMI|nr:uncharacterized protein COCMIDRAFT_85881 [Bipolaris oryzae ATCC 44560]EUC48931.1 hypothetical protein COCMIDRAFT_85881 [Bipolaris oryzae ATCC 44560]
MSPEPQKICIVCGDSATSKCPDCKSDTYSRYYCGKTCQEKDWPTHKEGCRDSRNRRLEKKLARIADILQQAYYIFRENTWDMPVAAIMVRDDLVEIYPSYSGALSFFSKFPDHLPMSEQTRNAILSAFSCNEPMVYIKEMISASFEGMGVKVEECKVVIGKITRKVIFQRIAKEFQDCSMYAHGIIRITVPGKRWIIDITGAQFGVRKTLWTWDNYKDEHDAKIGIVYALGTNATLIKALSRIQGLNGMRHRVKQMAADTLNAAIKEWTDGHQSIAAMLLNDENEYEETKLSLLNCIDAVIRSFVATNRFETEIRMAVEYELRNPGTSEKMADAVANLFTMSLFVKMRGRNSQ